MGAATADLFANQVGSGNLRAKWLWYQPSERKLRLAFDAGVADAEELRLHLGERALSFPANSGGDSSFSWEDVDIAWTDGQTVAVRVAKPLAEADGADETVTDDTAAPVVATASPILAPENGTAVLAATDADTAVADLTWETAGGADEERFTLSAAGVLAFAAAPDFEAPDDAGGDGDYEVTVRVSDGANVTEAALTVRLQDVDEIAPVLSSATVNETVLTLAWSETLDAASEPAAGAFTVTVGTAGRTVTGAAVSGSAVTLTLASAVAADETVRVGYAEPADAEAARVRDAAGNAAAGFTGQAVTNETAAAPAAELSVGAAAAQAGQFQVRIAFAEAVTGLAVADRGTERVGGSVAAVSGLTEAETGRVWTATVAAAEAGRYLVRLAAGAAQAGARQSLAAVLAVDVEAAGNAVAVAGPVVTAVALGLAPDGSWTAGDTVRMTLAFSEAMTVDTAAGTPSVGIALDGDARSAAYASGTGTASLVFGYEVTSDDGTVAAVTVTADSLAVNGGTIRDAAGRDADLAHAGSGTVAAGEAAGEESDPAAEDPEAAVDPDALTASFVNVPAAHGGPGSESFVFELAFSESPELSYKVLRDVSLAATDGAVRKAQRLERPSNIRWRITVEPSGWDDVTVTVLDDALDDGEGEETLTLALSNASGARIRDGAATGTIVNSDPLLRAWLARFGRTAAGHVLDAVGERLAGTRRDTQVSIAGRRLSAAPAADTPAYDDPLQRWEEPRTMQLAELVDGSSFTLLAATGTGADALEDGAGDGGRWTVWGRGGWSRFEGTQGELSLEGQVITATAGADYERDRLLAGLAVAYSSGDGTFDHAASGDSGSLRTVLLGVYPYVRLTLHERLAVWGLFGYAVHGELTLDEKETDPIDTGAGMLMGAFGARGTLLAAPAGGGFEVTATADGMVVRMRSEAVPGRVVATEADVERVRLLLNASYRIPVGGRYDGGDAETGAGLVVGGSLGYALSAWGLTLSAGGQGLLLHESAGFSEWSAGGSLHLDPGAPDRGVALSVAPSWGTTATTAATLWSLPDAARLAAQGPAQPQPGARLAAELSYGLDALDGAATVSPYAGLTVADGGARTWRVGTSFRHDPSLSLSLEGTRREHAGAAEPGHTLELRASLRH